AEFAAAHQLHRLLDLRPAPPLVAHLHAAVVLAGGLDHQLALARVVAARLLDVDVLAGGAGQDRGRGVPVVAGRNDQRLDPPGVEDAAEVGDGLRRLALDLTGLLGGLGGAVLVGVADVGDLDAGLAAEVLDVVEPAAAHAHDADAQLVVGGDGRAGG